MKLIQRIRGSQKQGVGLTRLMPTGALLERFNELGRRWVEQKPNPPLSLLHGRENLPENPYNPWSTKKKTERIWVPDNDQYNKMRDDVYRINSELVKHRYYLDLDDEQLAVVYESMSEREKEHKAKDQRRHAVTEINLYKVQLRRILNGKQLDGGGRFYGGWWQQIPGKYRNYMRIDDHKTVEADFSAMTPRILYAWANADYDAIKGDFYDIGLSDWKGKSDPRRDVVKRFVNTIINAKDDNCGLKKLEEKTLGLTTQQAKEVIYDKYSAINQFFSSGAGLKAQYVDSCIANDVMLGLAEENQVALPVHDSFIVRHGYLESLLYEMREAFKRHVGEDINIEVDDVAVPEHFYLSQDEIDELAKDPANYVIEGTDISLDELFRGPQTTMKKFGISS